MPVAWDGRPRALILCLLNAAHLPAERSRRTTMGVEGWAPARSGSTVWRPRPAALVAAPVRWTGGAFSYVGRTTGRRLGENRRLKRRVRELERLRTRGHRAPRRQPGATPPASAAHRSRRVRWWRARVVLDARGPSSTTRLANAGTEKAIRPGTR
jgi:hypothetical protein